MSRSNTSYRLGAVLMLAGGLAGGIISAYAYFTPLTGVSGTPGALLVILSSVLIFLASLIVALVGSRAWRNVLRVLLVLGIILTGVAGLFLLQPMLTAAMAVALVGWIIDCAQPARAARAREGAIA